MKPIIVGITGASGSILAERCIERLLERGQTVVPICTNAGKRVWASERPESFEDWANKNRLHVYGIDQIDAPIASGSIATAGMIVIPASMHTVAALAHGLSSNLLERAADVTIKELRRLVIVPREAPLSPIHLSNLLTLSQAGAIILPPVLTFYNKPHSIDDMVDYLIFKGLAILGLDDEVPEKFRYRSPNNADTQL